MLSTARSKLSELSGHVWRKLDWYQKDAARKALRVKTCALFMEQGTGKTWVAGAVIEQLIGPSFTGLVVANLNNIDTTWYTFVREHLPQLKLCKSWAHFKVAKAPKLLVLHYEGLKPIVKKLRKLKLTLIAYDEAQRLKERGTRQSRDAALLRNCAPHKLILSGTPIEENPTDLWAQFRFLNPSVLGDRWADFAAEFLTEPPDFRKYRPGTFEFRKAMATGAIKKQEFRFDMLPELIERIEPYTVRIDASVLKLKEMTKEMVPVLMFGDQRRVYEDMETRMVSKLRTMKTTAELKITQIGKLQQVCGGFIFDDNEQLHYLGRAKLRKTKYLVRRRTGPCVIFCKYRPEIELLEEGLAELGSVAVIRGSVKKKDRAAIVRDFQAGKIDILICQVKTGGVGIDLYRSNYAICYSLTHSRIDFEQLTRRVQRRGQKRAVRLFLLYVPGTVDEDIMAGVWRKNRLTNRVLTQLIQRRHT